MPLEKLLQNMEGSFIYKLAMILGSENRIGSALGAKTQKSDFASKYCNHEKNPTGMQLLYISNISLYYTGGFGGAARAEEKVTKI